MSADPSSAANLAAAFMAGLATSVHCVGMCGPLACAASPLSGSPGARHLGASAYHASKLFAYAFVGAVAGAAGSPILERWESSPGKWLPWLLVVALVLIGLGLEKKIPQPGWARSFFFRVRLKLSAMPLMARGAVLGGLTPLLPCGPLYVMFGLALASGSALRGVELTVAFGLGTIPLLFLVQSNYGWLASKFSPSTLLYTRRGVALVAAAICVWRLRGTLGLIEPGACPCCG